MRTQRPRHWNGRSHGLLHSGVRYATTDDERIEGDRVVNAGGAWTGRIADPAGAELPAGDAAELDALVEEFDAAGPADIDIVG